jgi:hypothetical protein
MAQPWTAKDPQAVLDYVYRIPLDAGDSVSSATPWITKLSGDVVIDSQSLASAPNTTAEGYGQDVTVWLSGGTDGETCVFRAEWATAGGRTDDDIITMAVAAHEIDGLVLTGYAKPLPGHLTARYPAFAAVATSTIRAWLTDAERFVTTAWAEGDYAAGLMSLAAHNMALAGLGTDAAALVGVPAGITRMKSGSLELGFTDQAANARMSGGYDSTRYGAEYALLLRRNRGGPYVAPTGIVPEYAPFGVGWPW